MAKIEKIAEKNEKKLNISQYLDDSIKELDSGGNIKQDDFITIKKLKYSVKKKLEFLAINSFSGQTGKNIFSQLKKKNYDFDKMSKMTPIEQAETFSEMKLSEEDTNVMAKMTIEMAKNILEYGIDPYKHSFFDTDNKPVELNYSFWENIGSEKLIDYVIKEIKDFSAGIILGESIEPELKQP